MLQKLIDKLFPNPEYDRKFQAVVNKLKASDNIYDIKLATILESSHNNTLDMDEFIKWGKNFPEEKLKVAERARLIEGDFL